MHSHTILRPAPHEVPTGRPAGPGESGRWPSGTADCSLATVLERVDRLGRDVIYTALRRLNVGPLPRLLGGTGVFPQVLWRDPSGDALLGGIGAIVALESRHPEDLPHVIRRCQAVAGRHPAPDPSLHRIFGGFAFDPDAPANPRWPQGWQVRFFLPQISLRQGPADGPEADVAIRVKVHAGMTAQDVERRVSELAGLLEDWREAGALACDARARAAGLTSWRRPHPRQGRDRWFAGVQRIVREIAAGGLRKLVLSRDIDLLADPAPDAGDLFARIVSGCPGSHGFMFRFDGERAFLGASPERLIAVEGDRLLVDCLAGTAPRGASPDEDLARAAALSISPKDGIEHELVVNSVAARLQPFCTEIEYPERPLLKALPALYHLHTPVQGRLFPEASLGTLVAALHPTPAVAGIPSADSRRLIRLLEGRPRGWYGGAVGWIGDHAAELAVAIRCMTLHPDGATLTVGAGIVEGSTPEGEWAETELKAETLLGVLGIDGP